MVGIFGNDVDIVTDAEIALERFCETNSSVLEFLVANHLDLELVLDRFKNGRCGARDNQVVVVDDCGEYVSEFWRGAVEVAVHVDDEFALVTEFLNGGRGVLLVFSLLVDGGAGFFFGMRRIGGRYGCNSKNPCDDGKLDFKTSP